MSSKPYKYYLRSTSVFGSKYSAEWLERLQLLHYGLLDSPVFETLWDDDAFFSQEEFKKSCSFWQGPRGERITKVTGTVTSYDCLLTIFLDNDKIFSFKFYVGHGAVLNSFYIFLREFDADSEPIRKWLPDPDQFAPMYEGFGCLWQTVWHWTETRER